MCHVDHNIAGSVSFHTLISGDQGFQDGHFCINDNINRISPQARVKLVAADHNKEKKKKGNEKELVVGVIVRLIGS